MLCVMLYAMAESVAFLPCPTSPLFVYGGLRSAPHDAVVLCGQVNTRLSSLHSPYPAHI